MAGGQREREGGASTDLCSEDFSAIAFLNEAFAGEPTVEEVDPLVQKLKQRIRRADADMVSAVRQQASTGAQAQADLGAARDAVCELASKVEEVQCKADESEHTVDSICKDIKRLDSAKQHLTSSITSFRRLGMLICASDQLEYSASHRQYTQCASLLRAVSELYQQFDGYDDVPKIAELRGKLNATHNMLRSNVLNDFSYFGKENISSEYYSVLSDACYVVNAMDKHVREELINTVCQKELTAYNQIFNVDQARLDRVERRYNWFKRELYDKSHAWGIFPEDWQVKETLCEQFCKLTRAHVAEMLDSMQEPDVQGTLQAMHKTIEFEKEMDQRFGQHENDSSNALAEFNAGDSAGAVEDRVASIRDQYLRNRSGQDEQPSEKHQGLSLARERKQFAFLGAISSCFEPHLSPYVEMEEKQLMERVDSITKEETWQVQDTSSTQVLGSASQVFVHIKKVLNRCASLTSRKALFEMHTVFKRVLVAYASKVKGRLPSEGKGTERDDRIICFIINTAEYCKETVSPLSDSLIQMLDEEYQNSVDFSEAEEAFTEVVGTALSSLVCNVEGRMESALSTMIKTNWAAVENVGDQSEYVDQCNKVLNTAAPTVGPLISSNHFRYFIDKLAASFCPKVYSNIFKCKRFNETGAQQMLLDVHALKTALLEVATLGSMSSTPTSFTRLVTTELGRAESLLKVILSPTEGLAETFRALLPESGLSEFKQVLDLKGLKKSEQTSLTDEYNKTTGRSAEMSEETNVAKASSEADSECADGSGPQSNASLSSQQGSDLNLNLRMSSQYSTSSSKGGNDAFGSHGQQAESEASHHSASNSPPVSNAAPFAQAKSGFQSAVRNARSMMRIGDATEGVEQQLPHTQTSSHQQSSKTQMPQQPPQQQQQQSSNADRWRNPFQGRLFQ